MKAVDHPTVGRYRAMAPPIRFGSTPCKALYKCLDCREPFEHFKAI